MKTPDEVQRGFYEHGFMLKNNSSLRRKKQKLRRISARDPHYRRPYTRNPSETTRAGRSPKRITVSFFRNDDTRRGTLFSRGAPEDPTTTHVFDGRLEHVVGNDLDDGSRFAIGNDDIKCEPFAIYTRPPNYYSRCV